MKTYYDVLKLKKTCNQQDIRDAFLALSKLYHPDKCNDSKSHKKFVEIQEAYSTLRKTESRRLYDMKLQSCQSYSSTPTPNMTYHPNVSRTYSSEEYLRKKYAWEYHEHKSNKFDGNRKITIAIICVFIIFCNSILEVRRTMIRTNRQQQKIAKEYRKSRERAQNLLAKEVREIENRIYGNMYLKKNITKDADVKK